MELVLVLVGGAIGLASAMVITLINNRYERGRIQDVWKLEVQEREAQARRQRLERVLDPVRAHLNRLLQIYSAAKPGASRETISKAEALLKFSELSWQDEIVRTAVAIVRDETLDEAFTTFHSKVYGAGKDVAAKAEFDKQCALLTAEVIESAAAVLRRCDELLEEAYAEAILNALVPAHS